MTQRCSPADRPSRSESPVEALNDPLRAGALLAHHYQPKHSAPSMKTAPITNHRLPDPASTTRSGWLLRSSYDGGGEQRSRFRSVAVGALSFSLPLLELAEPTAGPARLAITDRGLTFATNGDRGVLLTFATPVQGLDPVGLLRHPELTVTVADTDRLAALLNERRSPNPGPEPSSRARSASRAEQKSP